MPSINKAIGDGIKAHSFDVLKVSNRARAKVLAMLKKLERQLAADLARADPTLPQRTEYQQARLEELYLNASETIQTSYKTIAKNQKNELRSLAEITYKATGKIINREVGVRITDTFISKEQYEALADDALVVGAPSKVWWNRQAQQTKDDFIDAMRTGVQRGETLQELTQRIIGGTRKGVQIPAVQGVPGVTAPGRGLMTRARKNAEALVRTSYLTVASEARRALYKANEGVIKGTQQVSTLDGRTTQICMAYSGAAWDLDLEPIPPNTLPYNGGVPRHFGCRSAEVPVLKTASEILGIPGLPEIPKGTRASMDGQVPEDLSFDKWLSGKDAQNPAFADKMLGVGKAELWREGKISLQDLVGPDGDQKTLADLRSDLGEDGD